MVLSWTGRRRDVVCEARRGASCRLTSCQTGATCTPAARQTLKTYSNNLRRNEDPTDAGEFQARSALLRRTQTISNQGLRALMFLCQIWDFFVRFLFFPKRSHQISSYKIVEPAEVIPLRSWPISCMPGGTALSDRVPPKP